jgi:hypothetical protein
MLQRALPGFGLTIVVLVAVFMALIGVPGLPVALVVGGLCGYQFIGLRTRAAVLPLEQRQAFMRPHLRWLATTAILSLIIGGIALLVRVRPSFSILALLALIGVGLLAQAVRRATKDQA